MLTRDDLALLKNQFGIFQKETSSLIYFTLEFYGKMRPRDIKKRTGIATGRMYNELSLMVSQGLVQKENVMDGKTAKPYYSTAKDVLIKRLIDGSINLDTVDRSDKLSQELLDLQLAFISRYPVMFQNFISRIITYEIYMKLKGENTTRGNMSSQQEILSLDKDTFEILQGKLKSFIYDVEQLKKESKEKAEYKVAINFSMLDLSPRN